MAHGIGTNEASLSWALPQSFGGFALQGYCVQAQVSGDGGWKEWISHTRDVHPVATVTKLAPTSWYEFRVAAINVNGAGPWSEASEPILTLASHVGNHGKVQRQRRRRWRLAVAVGSGGVHNNNRCVGTVLYCSYRWQVSSWSSLLR